MHMFNLNSVSPKIYLVNLIQEDYSLLAFLDIVVGVLQELGYHGLDVFANVASLSKGGTIADSERNVQTLGHCGCQQSFPRPSWTFLNEFLYSIVIDFIFYFLEVVANHTFYFKIFFELSFSAAGKANTVGAC